MQSKRREERARRAATKAATTAAGVLLGALLCIDPAAAQFAGRSSMVSLSTSGDQATDQSWDVSTSADGRLVAFASDAPNLVTLDTNNDTDVFVRDTATGVTERVSITWQGQEARNDSACPSMSADGRYVAFRSRAWNMYSGGANLGEPVWQVYLHDRQGPSTVRVSAPIGGGNPSEDSSCPAISADGSTVAFASEIPNLVPDDTNDVADVFAYDVASGNVTRVSVASDGEQGADGSIGGFGSEFFLFVYSPGLIDPYFPGAPGISADGNVVVFTSGANNFAGMVGSLVQVYAHDRAAGTTDLVSSAFGHPINLPDYSSRNPRVSGDGRFVTFLSAASNIGPEPDPSARLELWERLFLHDRQTGTNTRIDRTVDLPGACGSPAFPQPCGDGATKASTISADGRFIAYLSGSWGLVPENFPVHNDQIYLLDRQTGRTRRLTVGTQGMATGAFPCGGSANTLALSADGRILTYVGEDSTAMGLDDSNGDDVRDVVQLDWNCRDGGGCRRLSLCPAAPGSCEAATSSRLQIRRRPPGATLNDHFYWRWTGASEAQGTPFVDPTSTGDYHLCVYAGDAMVAEIDAGLPAGGDWRSRGKTYSRVERGGALEVVKVKRSARRSAIVAKSSEPSLSLPYLPIAAPHGIAVQLHESSTGRCWGATFPTAAISANFEGLLGQGAGTSGQLRADLR